MQIQFDASQSHQIQAMRALVDIFEGQPLTTSNRTTHWSMGFDGDLAQIGFGNHLSLDDAHVLDNVRKVQQRNGLDLTEELDGMHFSVEMETGTGKTYVYLRTIYELFQTYGFRKFIIVVPSVPIREGVLKNLDITQKHFSELYSTRPEYWVYDSKRVSRLRQFATSNRLQILVMNIDAFNKDSNIIHQEQDTLSGYRPIEFIQTTHPIVIVDEPQNMESEQARTAIASLNPLCTLRFSATHRHPYNMVYRLDPVRAYQLNLVKRIEVDSIVDDPDFNRPFIALHDITASKKGISCF